MQRELLCLQVRDPLFESLDRDIIGDRQHYSAVPADPLINLNALLAHGSALAGGGTGTCRK